MDKDIKITAEDRLEISRIIGQPVDPRKPYPDLVNMICERDTAEPEEYVYYFDVIKDTDTVYTITSTGSVTSSNVSPDTPTLFSFIDLASPEYYVKITDLAKAKERVLARKNATINRALNGKEIEYILTLIEVGVPAANRLRLNDSGTATRFNVDHLTQMCDLVKDYGDSYVLLVSSTIEKDIILWNWNDNKNIDIFQTFDKLGVTVKRIPNQSVVIDGSTTNLIGSNKAYLVATSTESSVGRRCLLFVRKRLNDIALLGGVLSETGDKPERLVFTSPNPMNVGGTRYLGVGLTGYEEIIAAVVNSYGLASFDRV
jgi:hypothetical protein